MELIVNIAGRPGVRDFHETDAWKEARCVVAALLEATQSWSRRSGPQKVAREIESLSVSLLQQIIHGFPMRTNQELPSPVQKTIGRLELLVDEMGTEGALTQPDSLALKSALGALKEAFGAIEL